MTISNKQKVQKKYMTKILKIDRALYEVDDKTKTCRYNGRNLDWKNLNVEENRKNKKRVDGYARIFPRWKKKVFRYKGYIITWKYTKSRPCKTCYSWDPWSSSSCDHKKLMC
jgi:hypothetical protein